jgi:hypothetical protein
MVGTANKIRAIPKEFLEEAAYYHWLDRGCPWGDPLTDWLAAEREGPAQRSWLHRLNRTHRASEPFAPSGVEHA